MLHKCLTNEQINIQYSLNSSLHTTLCLKTTTGIAILNLNGVFYVDS